MALPNHEIAGGIAAELAGFEELLRSLTDDDLDRPTRCEGWTVRDVAAHVVGTHADIVAGRTDGLGTPEVTDREVTERRDRTAKELADELLEARAVAEALLAGFDAAAWASPSPAGYSGTLADGVEALWFDAFLHADDIRSAIGRPTVVTDGLRATLSHLAFELTKREWGPATLAFEGLPPFDISGGGPAIAGDPVAFSLAATGRSDPAPLGLDATVNIYAA